MYQKFEWTKVAKARNSILRKYEPIQPYVFLELAKEIDANIFIDIGANIGAYSIFLSSLDKISKIYAFEADPQTFEELKRNVQLNDHLNKIEIFNTAISDCEKELRFGIVGEYSGANSIIGTSIHSAEKFVKEMLVNCVPLDNIVTEKSRRVCVKVDVEGHEKEAITGACNVLRGNEAVIQLENYDRDDSSLRLLLESYNYKEILSIGPDMYFTNIQEFLEPEVTIRAFEKATAEFIKSNFEPTLSDADQPVRVRLLFGVAVEISGRAARFARKVRDKLHTLH
jgi:FkbM family methyltransferase